MRLAQAGRKVDASFAAFDREPRWFADVSAHGVLGASLQSLARWLRSRQ